MGRNKEKYVPKSLRNQTLTKKKKLKKEKKHEFQ